MSRYPNRVNDKDESGGDGGGVGEEGGGGGGGGETLSSSSQRDEEAPTKQQLVLCIFLAGLLYHFYVRSATIITPDDRCNKVSSFLIYKIISPIGPLLLYEWRSFLDDILPPLLLN